MAGPSRARQYLRGERDVRGLASAATAAGGDDTTHGLWADLTTSWRLVKAYVRGDYRHVRLRSVLAVLAGLLYFITPMDLIPDVVLLLGFTDDLLVVSLVFSMLRQELAGFRAWELESSELDVTVLSTVREG